MSIDFTDAELKEFSPHMADLYVHALLDGKGTLAAAGILDNGRRFSHFMGQFGAETNGGQLVRENMNYSSVQRIKEVWPSRAKKAIADGDPLTRLVHNPKALANWAYGGRLGNRLNTDDGYDFRGGGFLQTTGRENVEKSCKLCGIPMRADILDDHAATLAFACAEWQHSGCNELADKNDLLGISRTINTGSANSGIYPNGMEDRETWFDDARAIWWDDVAPPPSAPKAVAAAPPTPVKADTMTVAKLSQLVEDGSRIAMRLQQFKTWLLVGSGGGATVAAASTVPTAPSSGTGDVISAIIKAHPLLSLGIVATIFCTVGFIGLMILQRYLLTAARDGRYSARGATQ